MFSKSGDLKLTGRDRKWENGLVADRLVKYIT